VADGAGKPCIKCYVAFAATLVIVLAATGVWNPFPGMWEWVNRSEPLSTPDVAWQKRLGGSPKSVTIAGDAVVVEHRTTVEALSLSSGVRMWEKEADWAAVAGEGNSSVVVTGELLVKGYQVLDPLTGAVRRRDSEAVGVWTFRNGMLDVRCIAPQDCTLTSWDPRGAVPLWRVQLPGVGFVLFADNPEVLGTRPLTAQRVHAGAAGPILMPQLIGFPIDGRVYVVDTGTGRMVRELELNRKDRVVVAGGRVLSVLSDSRDGTCYFTIVASDAETVQEVWRQAGLNLRTAEGSGCVQRKDPAGGDSVLLAVAPDGREVLIDAYDGRIVWVGQAGQRVLAIDSVHALVRAPNGTSIVGYELGTVRGLWLRRVHPEAQAALSPYAAVVVDRKPDRVIALDLVTGDELLVLRTSAEVAAVGPGGLIIVERREIGYARFTRSGSGVVPPPGPPPPGASPPGPAPGPGEPTCRGPKNEVCDPPEGGKDD
jgi:outer membrane protein assembly factor BamB